MGKLFKFNKKIALFFLIFSALFFCSQQADAFFDVIPALASMQLDALDFIDRVVAWLFNLLLLALGGAFFITFSANLLDWASNLPINLNNPLVNAGWGFTSGLVNVIFILIFVFIAFSYILKLETFGMKKALPRLIIIAFLLNFSLLFVKMFVDIGWILQNSLKVSLFGTGGIAAPVAEQMAKSAVAVVSQYLDGFFLPYFIAALIPFANVARVIFFAGAVLGEGLFGTFSETALLAIFSFVGGLIFLVYAILFLARIAVIWLLAIVAPFAFVAYILPQTQKYFSQWLKTLFQWVFLGVVVFFLMGLGLKLFAAVAPSSPFEVRDTNLVAEYSKFLFLLIYLFISLMMAKKFIPTGANAIWSLGAMATGGIGAAATWAAKKGAMGSVAWKNELASKRAAARVAPLRAKETAGTITAEEKTQLGKWSSRFEMAETKNKMLKQTTLAERREKLLAKAPKDSEARKSYLRAELLKEEGKSAMLRDRGKISSIIDIAASEGKIGDVEAKFIADAVRGGADANKIMNKRPDLAPAIGKDIADVLSKISPEDLRKNMQAEAIKNIEVLTHVLRDQAKIDEFGKAGSGEIKAEIIKGIKSAPFNPRYLTEIQKTVNNMVTDPKWRF